MLGFPPRPKLIKLTNEQRTLLSWANETLMQCSRELYQNPQEAPAIGRKYWDLLGEKDIHLSQLQDEAWFPGALTGLYYEQARKQDQVVVLNPKAIENYSSFDTYVPVVVVKAEIDQVVVTSRVEDTTYIKFDPMQNLHVSILPEPVDDTTAGVKHIVFNEDYEYLMLDPDTLGNFRKSRSIHSILSRFHF